MTPVRRSPIALFVLSVAAVGLVCASALASASTVASHGKRHGASLRLRISPAHVRPGGTVVLHGAGFPARASVVLLATPPHGRRERIGSAHAGDLGTFDAKVVVDPRSAGGVYVAAACPSPCKRQATATFRVMRRARR